MMIIPIENMDLLNDNEFVYITEDGIVKTQDIGEYKGLIYATPIKVYEAKELINKQKKQKGD